MARLKPSGINYIMCKHNKQYATIKFSRLLFRVKSTLVGSFSMK